MPEFAMKTIFAMFVAAAAIGTTQAQPVTDIEAQSRKLDTELFAAYNDCDLAAFGTLLAPDIEFYHDKGRLMLGRQPVVDAVQKNICGKVRREPIEGTLTTYPMDDYGLLQLGEHRFCTADTKTCTGTARFVHLWRHADGAWQATRIISYDHQPLTAPDRAD
jgi:hypothetical protein